MKCCECRSWLALEDLKVDGALGECHRNAPTPSVSAPLGSPRGAIWPVTLASTFCGEFVAKSEKRVGWV